MSDDTLMLDGAGKDNGRNVESGGDAIVRALVENGITRGFCIPGESYLGILDALDRQRNRFDLVVCRHEGGASYMSEAYARVTGTTGVCLVTRGPGASNAMIGVSTAMHESTPLLLIIGHISTGTAGRSAFQEMDPKAVFSSIAKWVGVVERTSDIPHMINRALQVAVAGRPGPVVLAVPDDVQFDQIDVKPARIATRPILSPEPSRVAMIGELIEKSRNPIVIGGGNGWDETASQGLEAFARAFDLPVTTTFRRNDILDNDSPHYVGSLGPGPHPATVEYLKNSDLVLMLGGQLSEIETGGYSYLSEAKSDRKFIHAAPLGDEFGELLDPDLAIPADIHPLIGALQSLGSVPVTPWSADRQALRESYERYCVPVKFEGHQNPGEAVAGLCEVLPTDAIITAGAGNYTHFVLRHHRFKSPGTLYAPLSAPMGYSVPAAVAAAIANPDRETVGYVGDGCFFMNPQELVVAASRNLRLTIVMFNNGIYGSIRMHQERQKPGMSVATTLDNPDFQQLAASMGLTARQVSRPEDVATTYKKLRAIGDGPLFIELMTDPAVITPHMTI